MRKLYWDNLRKGKKFISRSCNEKDRYELVRINNFDLATQHIDATLGYLMHNRHIKRIRKDHEWISKTNAYSVHFNVNGSIGLEEYLNEYKFRPLRLNEIFCYRVSNVKLWI